MLRPGGWLAAVVIETLPGLGPDDLELAAELGPAEVGAEASLAELTRRAGLQVQSELDLTEDFARVLDGLRRGLEQREATLRAAEGDDEYEYELDRRRSMLEAVSRGLIRRTMVVARRS